MPAGYTRIEIDGVAVAPDDANRLLILSHGESLDGDSLVELAEGPGASITPRFAQDSAVAVWYDWGGPGQVCAFRGTITRAAPRRTPQGWLHAYTCEGLNYSMDRLPVWNATLRNMRFRFNMSTSDREYSASLTGMTVGAILKRILQDSESALAARGILLNHLADFDELDWVPLRAVDISGPRLLQALRGWLGAMAPCHRIVLEPTATAAEVRLAKLSGGQAVKDVVLGQEAVEFSPGGCSVSACASRVRIIGWSEIEAFELDTESGKLLEDWTAPEESAWSIKDFEQVNEAADEGDVVSMTATTVTVRSDKADREWDANFWAGSRRGRLRLEYDAIVGDGYELESQQTRDVTSCDALTSGGTAAVTVEREFTMNTFTRYKLYGLKEDTERPHVFRRYKPALPEVREHLAHWFAKNEPFETNNGTTTVWTTAPRGGLEIGGIFHEMPMQIDAGDGTIYFYTPTVAHSAVGNSRTDLETPGSELTVPNVKVFLPVSVRPLEVQCPADTDQGPYNDPVGTPAYAGTAYDWYGLEETWTEQLTGWQDRGAIEQIRKLACELHDSVKNVRMTANLTFLGFRAHELFPLRNRAVRLSAVQAPGSLVAVDLGHWGEIDIPIQAVSISWGGPSAMSVSCSLSTEMRPLHGQDFYTHGISLEGVTNDPYFFTEGLPAQGIALGGMAAPIYTTPEALSMGGVAQAQQISMGTTAAAQGISWATTAGAQGISWDTTAGAQQLSWATTAGSQQYSMGAAGANQSWASAGMGPGGGPGGFQAGGGGDAGPSFLSTPEELADREAESKEYDAFVKKFWGDTPEYANRLEDAQLFNYFRKIVRPGGWKF